MVDYKIDPLGEHRSQLGESPRWDSASGTLLSVDMVAGEICRTSAVSGAWVTHVLDVGADYLGAVVVNLAGEQIVVTRSGLATLTGNGVALNTTLIDGAELRLNDAACDSHGRVWVGSTSITGEEAKGSLHVWSHQDGARVVTDGLTLPNGIGWSPDNDVMYLADSGATGVLAAPFDANSGEVGEFRTLFSLDDGVPDGMCVGIDGTIWLAVWDGWRVERRDPEGRLIDSIGLPVQRPTSCALAPFGLVVTSARYELSVQQIAEQPLAGALLCVSGAIESGERETRSS